MKTKTSIKIFLFPAILFAVFFIFGNEARAAEYYVSPAGNDSNSGLIGAPFKTIQKAANVVNPGDTVFVRAGTYNERVTLTRSGTPTNYITFQNYPGETAILDGTGLDNGAMIHGLNVSYIKVIGLKIRNYTGAGIQFQPTASNGFSGSHIEIRDNEIYNGAFESVYGHAILVVTWPWGSTNTYTDIVIDGNYIHDVQTSSASGGNESVTLAGYFDRFQITNNTLINVSYIGIDLIGKSFQHPRNGIISGNNVSYFGLGCSIAASGIYIDGARNITIENNIVYDGTVHGIYTGNENYAGEFGMPTPVETENIIVRKNKVYNNIHSISIGGGFYGISKNGRVVHNTSVITTTGKNSTYFLSGGTGHIGKNNIGYLGASYSGTEHFSILFSQWNIPDNPTLDYNNYYPASATNLWYSYGGNNDIYSSFSAYRDAKQKDLNSITTDPTFTNLGGYDFTLQSSSPAIDAGDFLTRTTSSGSGTVITVSDARYFHDGYGISGVSGDTIRVGSNTVTVTGVNYSTNTLTVTPSITWSNGDGVSYTYTGSKPDIGAYEYVGAQSDTIPPSAPSGLTVQ